MEILVVFKTHLDLGYTDLAANVERRYMEEFIPHALDLAEAMKGTSEGFIWTTGSWLITRFLESSEEHRVRMEKAIRDGLIAWHALPFTMHVEMMDRELYEYGLTLSRRLDERFGKHTTAAKCTDVPGFTKAAVPLLADAGVKMIHIGVNPVSAVPDVPSIFVWRVDGREIYVVYDKTYGEITPLPGTDKLLCFAMTNDNMGPQNPEALKEFYDGLRAKYPEATVRAATLNEAADALAAAHPDLPVFEGEIGDSWAHGYQSDPKKQFTFRALLRYVKTLPESRRNGVYAELLKVAEHTCGLCGKRYINDDGNYRRADFELIRGTGKYAYAEQSWQEQRRYCEAALQSLAGTDGAIGTDGTMGTDGAIGTDAYEAGRNVYDAWKTVPPPVTVDRLKVGEPFTLGRFTLTVGNDGSVFGVTPDGEKKLPSYQRLFRFEYEVFSHADTMRFGEQYFKAKMSWGYDDFTKRGLDESPNSHILAGAHTEKLYRYRNGVVCVMRCEEVLSEKYGCPKLFTLTLTSDESTDTPMLCADFAWFGKPASRIPEGLWLNFDGGDGELSVRKLGMWINPAETVYNGGRSLHGTDYGVRVGGMTIESPDCSLVSFGGGLWNYANRVVREGDDVRFCLYNNQWNTNFPFWYEDDARFRFTVKL